MATKRKKREKQEAKHALKEQQRSALVSYLDNYGSEDGIQSACDSAFDSQIKNLSLPVATKLAEHKEGTVFDIGCGEGILLNRLVDIDAFAQNTKWIYFGVDFPEHVQKVLALARDLNVHRRVDATELSSFYDSWPNIDLAPHPYIVIIRNVFHELDIDQTATLLHHLKNNLTADDVVIIQDLQVFPVSERGNACWLPSNFCELLKTLGLQATVVSEPTARGNRWFTVHCRVQNSATISIADVRSAVIAERTKQLAYWAQLEWLAPDDERFREVRLAKLDFDLQYAALLKQLISADAPSIKQPTPAQQTKILQKSFAKTLASFKIAEVGPDNLQLLQGNSFRDRANYQDGLETFLREGIPVAVVYGGALAGKTALIKEVLSKRAYNKHVVLIDIQASSSVWNILEQLLSGLGCKIAPDLYGGLRNIGFDDIREEVCQLIDKVSMHTIVAIDHFEQALDPNSNVQDPEIRNLLSIIADAPSAKLIITSRKLPELGFISPNKIFILAGCPIGRFPEGNHVENVLNDFVNLGNLGVKEYPDLLLKAIDRHPYLSVLAGLTLKKDGSERLTDSKFLEKLTGRMREALLRDLVDDISRPAIKWLSMVRIPIPRVMVENLAGKQSVIAAEDAALIYSVYDRFRSDLVTSLGAIKRAGEYKDDLLSVDDLDNVSDQTSDQSDNELLAKAFSALYRTDDDPRWLREICYHRLATGDRKEIEKFGVYYKSEIFWAADYSYRVRKDYEAALWALEVAGKLGLKNTQAEMRRASCLVRTKKIQEGVKLFDSLIEKYPLYVHLKNALVDSFLYLGKYQAALDVLTKYELNDTTTAWVAHEYGRAYFGLRDYVKAANSFESQLRMEPSTGAFVYDNLARAYQHQGDSTNELRVIENGLARNPASNRLQLRHASHLVRMGTEASLKQAEPVLSFLHATHRTDGRVLQQYCKLLCRIDRVKYAREIWEAARNNISPAEYSTSIHVEILIQEGNWPRALEILKQVSQDNEHLVGMKKEVYLAWAKSETDVAKRREIANQGLEVQMDTSLSSNIPLLLTSARLARLAEEVELYQKICSAVESINPAIADILHKGEDELAFWEGDSFLLS